MQYVFIFLVNLFLSIALFSIHADSYKSADYLLNLYCVLRASTPILLQYMQKAHAGCVSVSLYLGK